MDWYVIRDIDYRISLASIHAPRDIFTLAARVLMTVVNVVSLVLAPVELVTTAVGGCLIAVTFGLVVLLLTLIWLPFLALLAATSWLWLNAWYLRPILLIPGVVLATVAHTYVLLAPDPEKDAKYAKLALADQWPLTWYLLKPPVEYYPSPTKGESEWQEYGPETTMIETERSAEVEPLVEPPVAEQEHDERHPTLEEQWQAFLRAKKGRTQDRKPPRQ